MYYDFNDKAEPLKPVIVWGNRRSVALEDFKNHHLDPISETYLDFPDGEMKARLADILWIRRKDHKAARIAVAEYLKLARTRMELPEWHKGFSRMQRALQIAGALGRRSSKRTEVAEYAMSVLVELSPGDENYLTKRIIDLLLEYGEGDLKTMLEFAEKAAVRANQRNDWMVAADYWTLVYQLRNKYGDLIGARQAMVRVSEAQISIGEDMAGIPGLAAEHWIQQAVFSLRKAGSPKEEQEPLIKRAQELQKERLGQLERIEVSVPLEPEILAHLDQVKGLDFRNALIFWAHQIKPRTLEDLKMLVLEKYAKSPLEGMIAKKILREDGKTDFILRPFLLEGQPEEELLRQYMWHTAGTLRTIAAWMVHYLRQIINDEHPWTDGCLDWLLNDNSFVPSGREPIFARGIRAAIEGDYLVATHLLIPQLENSFRYVLNQVGFNTTYLKQDGKQDEFLINEVMRTDAFVEIFGEDLAFDLRGLLAERAGSNMRNSVAHGLHSAQSFYSAPSIVLGPLTIWLLLHGLPKEQVLPE